MSSVNENISAGETVVAVLKRDGEPKRTIDDEGRFEITLTIRDRVTGEVEKYEVNK